MRKKLYWTFVIITTFFITLLAHADMVTFGQRFVVERSDIMVKLYTDKRRSGERINVKFIVGAGSMLGQEVRFICQDTWDSSKVHKASNVFRDYLNKHNDIEMRKMLSQTGLTECKYISK